MAEKKTKTTNQTEGKEVATVSDDELALALKQSEKLQEKENAGDGVKADYLLLAKSGSKALKKSEKDLYIEKLKIGDIYIQKDKVNLGSELKVVPLAFITLYNEKQDARKDSQFFGVWNKEQALNYPLVDGNNFNRQLPNGHILTPVNWVMVNVIGHPEIENAVIAFKSTGSRIWRKWKEDAKNRSGSCATLVYKIFEENYENADYSWTDFGFEYVESLLEKKGDKAKAEALACLKKSNAIRESYDKRTLIGNHDTQELSGKPVQAYIEDASETEESYDDEDSGF